MRSPSATTPVPTSPYVPPVAFRAQSLRNLRMPASSCLMSGRSASRHCSTCCWFDQSSIWQRAWNAASESNGLASRPKSMPTGPTWLNTVSTINSTSFASIVAFRCRRSAAVPKCGFKLLKSCAQYPW